ncbi:ABC transporter ATP-binding protein [Paraliobacillus salinarum]|uniref:ABC transporter ATP-binding protein n=1 Tax=Paraliobacillus salinarum TaxID=1158996 RepID=UPI001FEB4224|nr:ATP-binding cassette domain-containing protein [Paraliobacillus salinarum]
MKNETNRAPLLEVKDFALSFRVYKKGLREQKMQVIKKLNMTIKQGEVVAVIGASGSGKSLLADAVLGILPENAIATGDVYYKGERLTSEKQLQLRGKEISLIPQSVNALDPLMKIGKQVQSVSKVNNRKTAQQEIFRKINLRDDVDKHYPFELSGGMARRVLTAITLIGNPDLIIADEPIPGLDARSLADVISSIRGMADDGKGVMFITHDIDTALKVADRFVIMNQGETIEAVDAKAFTGEGEGLEKDYTKSLWHALPQNHFSANPSAKVGAQSRDAESAVDPGEKLSIQNLSYKLDNGTPLFDNISFDIHPGEIVGLMGDSGAGKTTLGKIIAGYTKPNSGMVTIDKTAKQKTQANPIQMVWQHPEQAINPKWTMKKVLRESGVLNEEMLSNLGIREEWLTRWPSELSGGELQRFSIARAFSDATEYLILDEITTMHDAITQAEIWNMLLKVIKQRKIGALVISHDYHLLSRVSHRIIDFNDIKFR